MLSKYLSLVNHLLGAGYLFQDGLQKRQLRPPPTPDDWPATDLVDSEPTSDGLLHIEAVRASIRGYYKILSVVLKLDTFLLQCV